MSLIEDAEPKYGDAIIEAQDALDYFEKEGLETFLWQAYGAARMALHLFPAYARALQARLGTDAKISDAFAKATMERVLSHLDSYATAKLTQRTKDSALLMRQRDLVKQSILHEVQFLHFWQRARTASSAERQQKFGRLKPTLNTVLQRVAVKTGIDRGQILRIYNATFTTNDDLEIKALLSDISSVSNGMRAPAASNPRSPRKVVRPSRQHVWRKKFKGP